MCFSVEQKQSPGGVLQKRCLMYLQIPLESTCFLVQFQDRDPLLYQKGTPA